LRADSVGARVQLADVTLLLHFVAGFRGLAELTPIYVHNSANPRAGLTECNTTVRAHPVIAHQATHRSARRPSGTQLPDPRARDLPPPPPVVPPRYAPHGARARAPDAPLP